MSLALLKYLVFIPCLTAPLSLLGSSLILVSLVRSRRQKHQQLKSTIKTSGKGKQQQELLGVVRSDQSSGQESGAQEIIATGVTDACEEVQTGQQQGQKEQYSRIEVRSSTRGRPHNKSDNASLSTPYERLVLGICIFDLFFSLGWSLGPLPGPEGYLPWSKGTIATCTFQGFLIYIGFASFAYNAMLMILFVLVIRYDISPKRLGKIEPVMHFISITYYLVTSILGLVWEVYGFAGSVCLVAAYPNGCELPELNLKCMRGGKHVSVFESWVTMFVFTAWVIIIVVCSIIVGGTVLQRFYRSRRYDFQATGNDNNRKQKPGQLGARTVREVIIQCLLYSFSFLNSCVWFAVQNAIWKLSKNPLDWFQTTQWLAGVGLFFLPLQGFFNFLIFMRPRFMNIRVQFKDRGMFFALKEATWYPVSSPQERQNR